MFEINIKNGCLDWDFDIVQFVMKIKQIFIFDPIDLWFVSNERFL